jgi:DNA-binding transcriptional LysR family regulator
MDRFESMTVLLAVADAGSLSAASRRLAVPLATVSRRISDLERRLDARLLDRSSRKAKLTDAGREFVEASRGILEDLEAAERAASGEYSAPRGELVISTPIVFGRLHVLPIVTAFLASYPQISVRLVQADRIVNLNEEHVDLAVRIGALPDSSLVALRVGAIRRIICASPGYISARGIPEHPDDIAAHDCIVFEGLAPQGAWPLGSGKAKRTVSVPARLAVNTAEAAIEAAVAGAGLTQVLSYQVADALKSGRLVRVLEPFEPEPWPVHLVHAGRPLMPQKLRAFIDFAAPRLKASLPALSS